MPSSTSRHLDPRIKRTRKLLEEAFHSLMAERPCDEISVGDITRRANVNRATFYAHFPDLHHFATEMLRNGLENAMRAGIKPGTPLDGETLVEFGTAVFEFIDHFFSFRRKLDSDKQLNIATTFQETIESFLSSWMREDRNSMRYFRDSTPENAAGALAWALYGGAVRWSRLPHRLPAAQAARDIVALLVR